MDVTTELKAINEELEREIVERQRAEEALRKSEERFLSVVQTASDAIITADSSGNVVFWNAAAEAMFGYPADEITDRPLTLIMPERYHEAHKERMRRLVSTGETKISGSTVELMGRKKDGSEFPLELSLATWKAKESPLFTAIIRDITERKRAETGLDTYARQQAALVQLSAELAASLDEAHICQTLVHGLRKNLGYDNLGLFLVDEMTGERVLRASAGWPDAPPDWRIPPGQGVTERSLLNGQLHYTPDVRREPDYVPGLGSGAEVDVPIRVGEAVVGVLCVESKQPNAFFQDDFVVLTAAANQASVALERARKHQAIKEAETRYRSLFDHVPVGLYRTTPEGQFVDANQALIEMLGYPDLDTLLKTNAADVYLNADARRGWEAIVKREKIVHDFEVQVRRHDGTIIWVRDTGRAIHHTDGQTHYYEGSLKDITARKRTEEKIHRRNRELALLNRVIAAATSTLDTAQILRVACRELTEAFGLQGAVALLIDKEETAANVIAEHLASKRLSVLGKTLAIAGNPAAEHILTHKTPLAITDAQTDKRLAAFQDLLRERDVASLFIVPIIVARGQVAGALVLATREKHAFNEEEIALAQNAIAAVGQALETARLHQALQSHAERLEVLRELDQAILEARSSEEIAQAALGHVRRLVPCQRASVAVINGEDNQAMLIAVEPSTGTEMGLGTQLAPESFADVIKALQRDEVLTAKDLSTLPQGHPLIQSLQAKGLRYFTAIALLFQGELIGSLNLLTDSPDALKPEHIEIAREVAGQLAVAIQQAQLQEELQRHTENLEALVGKRTTELQAALEQAQSADRVKSEFVSNVSHELRTPLTNIKLYLSLLTRGRPDKYQAYLDTLQREVQRLQVLIEGLLDLSRLDLGKIKAHLRPTDTNLLVGTLVTDRGALAADRGLSLDVDLTDGLPLALADSKLLEQVLTNLLTNAVNYTPAGGEIRLHTGMSEVAGESWVTVSVTDTGPGIPEKERAHLFERFYRGQAGRDSDAAGTGLGLAICQEIMTLHGGQIDLESQVDRGSTFTIWLQADQD